MRRVEPVDAGKPVRRPAVQEAQRLLHALRRQRPLEFLEHIGAHRRRGGRLHRGAARVRGELVHEVHEDVGLHRLGGIGLETGIEGAATVFFARVGGQRERGQMHSADAGRGPHPGDQAVPSVSGMPMSLTITINGRAATSASAWSAGGRGDDLRPLGAEHRGNQVARVGLVVNHQGDKPVKSAGRGAKAGSLLDDGHAVGTPIRRRRPAPAGVTVNVAPCPAPSL